MTDAFQKRAGGQISGRVRATLFPKVAADIRHRHKEGGDGKEPFPAPVIKQTLLLSPKEVRALYCFFLSGLAYCG